MPTVAFYGDSIVTGRRGISTVERRWTSIVSKRIGWSELNYAIDGLGFVRRRGPGKADDGAPVGLLADVLSSDADARVVALGGNDSVLVLGCEDQVRAAIARDLAALQCHFPSGSLAVMDLYSPFASDYPPGWQAVRAILAAEARRIGLPLVPGMVSAINDDARLLSPDGLHPNDSGHAALARSIEPHLRATFNF